MRVVLAVCVFVVNEVVGVEHDGIGRFFLIEILLQNCFVTSSTYATAAGKLGEVALFHGVVLQWTIRFTIHTRVLLYFPFRTGGMYP